MLPTLLVLGLLAPLASGHGVMVVPPSWFEVKGESGLSPATRCQDLGLGAPACMWFTNYTFVSGEPSLPPHMRTYQDLEFNGTKYDWTKTHPWRRPGSAPVFSPCGVAGGNPLGCPVGGPPGECPGGGFGYGPAAENVSFPGAQTTVWRAGGVEKVGWGITANHGGGYSYRLCRAPAAGEALTEECFQQTVLRFSGDTQWVQYGDSGPSVVFRANRTVSGTWPPGSQWTRNPIPACAKPDGGAFDLEAHCVAEGGATQFPAPGPGLYGFGTNAAFPGFPLFLFTVMDKVEVPAELSPGHYVLSFRWDCEQTPQIWTACANVNIACENCV